MIIGDIRVGVLEYKNIRKTAVKYLQKAFDFVPSTCERVSEAKMRHLAICR
jgi:hypothetical protein